MKNGESFYVRPGNSVDIIKLRKDSSLDDAQAAALVSSLQRSIALIQGPPGTGKSFTGVALIKVLLDSLKLEHCRSPVICVCYTNHALGQLLESLIENGVTNQIVRIGSQSKSEKLEAFNLREMARNQDRTKEEKGSEYDVRRQLEEHEEGFHKLKLGARISADQLVNYLSRQSPTHHKELFGKDREGFQKAHGSNPQRIITSWLSSGNSGNSEPRSVDRLRGTSVFHMSRQERQALHRHWLNAIRDSQQDEAVQIITTHRNAKQDLEDIHNEVDLRCLQNTGIIGVTTTGLARNLRMLRKLRSKIMLCEEAGEVLEAHLLTALLPSVEHAILISDHLQLRPQIQNYELSRENPRGGEQYSLDVSLFERLIGSEHQSGTHLPYITLETQRRMHPSIAQLVRDPLYPQLKDAPSVMEYPEVAGMRK